MIMMGLRLAAFMAGLATVEAQTAPTSGCDSEEELLANLQWAHSACSQAGESFEEAEALLPSSVTSRGCAEVVRRVAHDCDALLLHSPVWFAGQKALLDAAVASSAAIPDLDTDHVYHISDPALRTIHTCGAVLTDGFEQHLTPAAGQSRIAIDVGPSRGRLSLDFELLTLDEKANDNLRLYSDEAQNNELRAIFASDLPLAEPILISANAVYILLVSDGASRHTSFRVTIGCVCEDSTTFVDADIDGCVAYASTKHGLCADLANADHEVRAACPLACGACEVGPCDVNPCQNGGLCTEPAAADAGHRRLQLDANTAQQCRALLM